LFDAKKKKNQQVHVFLKKKKKGGGRRRGSNSQTFHVQSCSFVPSGNEKGRGHASLGAVWWGMQENVVTFSRTREGKKKGGTKFLVPEGRRGAKARAMHTKEPGCPVRASGIGKKRSSGGDFFCGGVQQTNTC